MLQCEIDMPGHSLQLEENEDNAQATYGALKPFADLDLYVADEAYSTQLGWSEGSLVMAENIIRSYLGGGLPSWLPEQEWQRANLTSPGFDDTEGGLLPELLHYKAHCLTSMVLDHSCTCSTSQDLVYRKL